MAQNNYDKYYNKYLEQAKKLNNPSQPTQTPQTPAPQRMNTPTQSSGSIWDALGSNSYPDWYEPSTEEKTTKIGDQGTLINAVGAGLWSFVDTAAFGIPGALVEEEKFLDFEDPVAKWTGAIGGFAGFVGGAPLRVGQQILRKSFSTLASKQLKDVGKEGVEDVVKGMTQRGLDGGLSRSSVKEITGGYRGLASRAAVDPKIRGAEFADISRKYMDDFIEDGLSKGTLNTQSADAVKNMFNANVFNRPIQDFKGLMKIRGLAKTNPNLARVIGHTIDDIVMFGAIDTIFEGVTMIEDNNFDWTAPLWGTLTGAAFGQVAWLKPKGKASSWKKDFMAGVGSVFSKTGQFQKMSRENLIGHASLYGQLSKRNGGSSIVSHTFRNKKANINLSSRNFFDDVEAVWGKDAEKAIASMLQSKKVQFGKDLMKWSTKEELSNIKGNWLRMMFGGLSFNAQALAQTYFYGETPDINDVLPSFLIGAYVQRKSNPAKFDLNNDQMNKLRANLAVLGVDPKQFSTIPTFDRNVGRLDNIFKDAKFNDVVAKLEELEIISDSNEIVSQPLADDVVSADSQEGQNPVFDRVYDYMGGLKTFKKPKGNISAEDANTIADLIVKVDSDFATTNGTTKAIEKTLLNTQKDFEDTFFDLLESIDDQDNFLQIKVTSDKDGNRQLTIPDKILISEDIKQKAVDGKLDFLVDSEGKVLQGDEALEQLENKRDGFNSALTASSALNRASSLPTDRIKTISSESLMKDIYNKVIATEKNIDSMFIDNNPMSKGFNLTDDFNDYIGILIRNHGIRYSQESINVFSKDFDRRDELIGKMTDAGVLFSPVNMGDALLIDDIRNIEITDGTDSSIAKDKRFLGRVLALQSAVGGYKGHATDPNNKIQVTSGQVNSLRNYLNSLKINMDTMPNWLQSQLVDFAFKQRIQGTNLKLDQVDALFNLTGMGGAKFSAVAEGRTTGFRVKLIDESRMQGLDDSMLQMAADYNTTMNRIISDSNGLVTADAQKLTVVDRAFMQGLDASISIKGEKSLEAKQTLTEFMSLLATSKKGYSAFREQLMTFANARGGNDFQIINWLTKSNILKAKENQKGFDIDVEKFNDLIATKLVNKMNTVGVTPEYAKEKYDTLEQRARDNLIEDSSERTNVKHIDLNTFHNKYRIDGVDVSLRDTEAKYQAFKDLVYVTDENFDNKVFDKDILNKAIDRLHVKTGENEFAPFKELSKSEQQKRLPIVRGELIGLLGSQRAQIAIGVLSSKGGAYKIVKEPIQLSRFHETLSILLEVPYYLVDGRMNVTELSRNGNYYINKEVNIFEDGNVISKALRDNVKKHKSDFINAIDQEVFISDIGDLQGDGRKGLKLINIAPGLDPILIASKDLASIKQPFLDFINTYKDNESISTKGLNRLKELETKINNNDTITTNDYQDMLINLTMKEMLTGKDGDKAFIDFLNNAGNKNNKTLSRIKLFNTKKYVRHNKSFIKDVSNTFVEDTDTRRVLNRIVNNDGFGVAIWNDSVYGKVMDEVDTYVKDNNIEWNRNNVIGKAHEDVSAYDSIAYVSRDMMRYAHTMMGHDPNSFNPIKPVISSGGENSPLLLGKTLFVYSNALDGFFNKNKNTDILLTKTGAKVINPDAQQGQDDASLINTSYDKLNDVRLSSKQNRKISIESLGFMPNKDSISLLAKKSQADSNYMTAEESALMFDSEFSDLTNLNIDKMTEILSDPIILRKFMLESLGDEALVSDLSAGEGMQSISNMAIYSALSRDANPMSYSDRYVKNKLYNIYINSIINGQKSITNQFGGEDSHTYGGQAPIIQVPELSKRLAPTLVDRDGNMKSRGEALLPSNAKELTIRELNEQGYMIKLLKNNKLVDAETVMGKESWEKRIDSNVSLEGLHEEIKNNRLKNQKGYDGVSLAVMIRRNPRTRPNDFGIYSLKGFLEKTYGNSVVLNSMDVANVAEGDYDFDKADFFFAHKDYMWNHVERASNHFVQGINVDRYASPISYDLGMNATDKARNMTNMIGNANIFKKSIGLVQKVPRTLGYLDKLGADGSTDSMIQRYETDNPNLKFTKPKILIGGNKGQDEMIVMDFDNLDFYQRSALETQLILDASGNLNPEIASDIYNWKPSFLFPALDESLVPNEMMIDSNNRPVKVVNDMMDKGNFNNNRIRIFRKLVRRDDGSIQEVNLSNLDRSIITQMMNEYSKFLSVTNDSVYENTGAQRKSEHTDVYNGAETFFNFSKTIDKNIYWRLRNKYGSNEGIEGKKWSEDSDFKNYFDVSEESFKNFKGEQISYKKANSKILHPDVIRHGIEFAEGKRGAPVDRILWKFYDEDPFNRNTTRTVGGRVGGIIDTWYNELLGGGQSQESGDVESIMSNFESKADELTRGVTKGLQDYNRKARFIGNLKRKIGSILNSNMRYQAKKSAVDNLNRLITKLEKEIGTDFLPFAYKQSRKAKDLDKIEVVIADEQDMIDGSIYYATVENVKNFLPNGFALGDIAQKDLKFINKARKIFYGNRTNRAEFMEFGGKSLLTDAEINIINKFPEFDTFYEIESALLLKGIEEHGMPFLYSYMQPTQNKKAVGVFNNRPVSVPYAATDTFNPSSKYRRGIRLLTELASGTKVLSQVDDVDIGGNVEIQKSFAQKQLQLIAFIESQFNRFYNKRIDQKQLFSDEVGETLDVAGVGQIPKNVLYNDIRLPDFNKDFKKLFTDFNSIQWTKDKNKMSSGFGVMNDHLIDFYRSVMKLAGKENEFDSYLNKMSLMDSQMMSNDIISPIDYLAIRQSLDKEVRDIASDIFVGGKLKREIANNNQTALDIINNPVYFLMGGAKYYKRGISLEKRQDTEYNLKKLSDLKDMQESMVEMKNVIKSEMKKPKEEVNELLRCLK